MGPVSAGRWRVESGERCRRWVEVGDDGKLLGQDGGYRLVNREL